jgi:hypothetical protein
VHNGYFTQVGPYSFDVELYDDGTCTLIDEQTGLSASDAFSGSITEDFNLCPYNLFAAGSVNVMIDANSCFDPTDCYPDIEFDTTNPPTCQRIRNALGACGTATNGGNFLLRVETDNCPTPTNNKSWGTVKSSYR